MVTSDGYALIQEPTRNRINIILPQTWDTITNTAGPVGQRKYMLTEEEETIILTIVKRLFENEEMGEKGVQ